MDKTKFLNSLVYVELDDNGVVKRFLAKNKAGDFK